MSKHLSFFEFLNNEIDINETTSVIQPFITIPLIQRDYVQGRIKTGEKIEGESFINAIFNTIQRKEIMLDYIYGNINGIKQDEKNQKSLTFIPLDGQQRLTTLFLLYWYVGNIELDEESYQSLQKKLQYFSYETRLSAKDFCNLLCTMDKFSLEDGDIIELIKSKKQFYNDYMLDPTITSMLNMISRIDYIYREKNIKYYDKLENIKFDLLVMNNFGLSEELYIKMNARGKKLTDFENFKADFINCLNEKAKSGSFKEELLKIVNYQEREYSYIEMLSLKLDNDWLNKVWKISNKEKGDIDKNFKKFFYAYFAIMNDYKKIKETDKKADGEHEFLSSFYDYDNFSIFEELIEDPETIENMEKFFDVLLSNYDEILNIVKPKWYDNFDPFTINNDLDKLQLKQLLIICIIEMFVRKTKSNVYTLDDDSKIKMIRWARVINNIIENTDVDNFQSYRSCLRVIRKMSDHIDDIYNYLATTDDEFDASTASIEEEILKAKLIERKSDFEKHIVELEKNQFLRGSIYFVIEKNITIDTIKHRTKIWNLIYNEKENPFIDRLAGENHLLLKNIIKEISPKESFTYQFTDIDESEHFLKKRLRDDEKYQILFKKILDMESVDDIEKYLKNNIKDTSTMSFAIKSIITDKAILDWSFANKKKSRYHYKSRCFQFSLGSVQAHSRWISFNENRYNIQKYLFENGYYCNDDFKLPDSYFTRQSEVEFIKDGKSILIKEYGGIYQIINGESIDSDINYINDKDAYEKFLKWYESDFSTINKKSITKKRENKDDVLIENSTKDDIYYLKSGACNAQGIYKNNEFIILKGSILNDKEALNDQQYKKYHERREKEIQLGNIKNNKVVKDIKTNSPSESATLLLGHRVSGIQFWKDKNGVSIRTLQEKG